MSFEDFLNHKCAIYHLVKGDASPGYGLPGAPSFSYPEVPDLEHVPCHFGLKSSTVGVAQNKPNADYEARIKLTLALGTDIRLNDKVVDEDTGYEYTAEVSRNIRDHHLIVNIKRTERQKPL